jgi:hypothetical protein
MLKAYKGGFFNICASSPISVQNGVGEHGGRAHFAPSDGSISHFGGQKYKLVADLARPQCGKRGRNKERGEESNIHHVSANLRELARCILQNARAIKARGIYVGLDDDADGNPRKNAFWIPCSRTFFTFSAQEL